MIIYEIVGGLVFLGLLILGGLWVVKNIRIKKGGENSDE